MIACTVCGLWSPHVGPDRFDICQDCWRENFSGNLLEGPTAREVLEASVSPPSADPLTRAALEAFVDSPHPLTPRQVEVMGRMARRWQEDEAW